MIKVSATKLRNNLFDYLDKTSDLVPTRQINWRDKMTIKPKIMVIPEEFIKPIEDIWEDYV